MKIRKGATYTATVDYFDGHSDIREGESVVVDSVVFHGGDDPWVATGTGHRYRLDVFLLIFEMTASV